MSAQKYLVQYFFQGYLLNVHVSSYKSYFLLLSYFASTLYFIWIYSTTSIYFLLSAKEQEKSRSGIATPNRHLFLLLFIFTFYLRSVQEHHQQCSILKNLDVVQCFQHEVRVHVCQRFCPIGVFYELLCSITFQ